MKKTNTYKIIWSLIFVILLTPLTAYGQELNENLISTFKAKIQLTDSFKEYEEEIISLYASNEAETVEGYRITLVYEMETSMGEKTIVFVGDENFDILFSGIIELDTDKLSVLNLSDGSITSIGLFGPPKCETFRCTKTRTKIGAEWDSACNTIVGSACNIIKISPFKYILCRVGVVIACTVQVDQECVEGDWVPYCEY